MLQTSDERNRDLIVNVNGILSHRDQAVYFAEAFSEALPGLFVAANLSGTYPQAPGLLG